MARRSLKGHVAHCSTGFLRFLNIIVALSSIPLIVITFFMRPSPTPAGWGFIILGILTLISGLIGTCTVNQPSCFGFHLFFILLTGAGNCAAALVTFIIPYRVQEVVAPTITNPPPDTLVKGNGIVCFALCCFQVLVLVLGAMVNICGLTDYYEDLEGQQPSARQLAKQQEEDERRRSKIEATSAHQLAVKMKEKYGQWQQPEPAK